MRLNTTGQANDPKGHAQLIGGQLPYNFAFHVCLEKEVTMFLTFY